MILWDIVQSNYACVIGCVLLIIFVITDRSFARRTEALFLTIAGLFLCLTLVDTLELLQAQLAAPTFFRRFYSAVGYALRPSCPLLIVFIMHRNDTKPVGVIRPLLETALLALNALLCFVSIDTEWVFGYTADNLFFRGPLGLLPFITAGVYVMYMVGATFVNVRVRTMEETLVIVTIALLSILGTLLESGFHLDGTLNASGMIGTLFYYLYIHVHVYSRDQLTSAYSRRIFFMDVNKLRGRQTVVIGLDMNDLKRINDRGGHKAGDEALITFVATIQRCLPASCTIYRMGGDEFNILCRRMTPDRAEELMRTVKTEMDKTPYRFAYGCAPYEKEENIHMALDVADTAMYAMKTRMKAGQK